MKKRFFQIIISCFSIQLFILAGCADRGERDVDTSIPYNNPVLSVDQRVSDLLSRMTLTEKIGQMIQAERSKVIFNNDISTYLLGSVLSGGGSVPPDNTQEAWIEMYNGFQENALLTRLKIPVIYGIDAVHGHNNVLNATIFPHNIGLGAANDPKLMEQIGKITAIETASTGIDWTFAPCIAAARDERWGRTYESYSEDPALGARLGAAFIRGSQAEELKASGAYIAACAKHFAGDGGTYNGIDQGDTQLDEETFRAFHVNQYKEAIAAGVDTIMVSFSSYNGEKMHGSKYWITDVLKNELGFSGFVISDWEAVGKLHADYRIAVKTAINAGIDMIMEPNHYKKLIENIKELVESAEVPMSRIDDAVSRILKVKYEMGLFEHPFVDEKHEKVLGSESHRKTAREAVRKSLVLLKNKDNVLPLSKKAKRILVSGKSANDIGIQCGGWTITWQGESGAITEGTTVLEGIKQMVSDNTEVVFAPEGIDPDGFDAVIAVVGELPYAEGAGDDTSLSLESDDLQVLAKLTNRNVPLIVILVSGRPMIITEQLESWDAFAAAWLPGTEANGIADVLFGDFSPTGKLSYSWPRSLKQIPINKGDALYDPLFPFGFGLTY